VAFATQKAGTASGANDAYARLAARFGGKFTRGGWFSKPSVRFAWHGTHVLVDVSKAGSGGGQCTQVLMSWPDTMLRLEVYPAGVWSRVSRFLGMDSMRIGAATFDEQYVINTDSPDLARRFLSAGVQWHIDRISRLLGTGDVLVAVERGTLMVRKKAFIRGYPDLESFVRLCLELYEQGLLTQSAGIEFVAGGGLDGPPKCQVCLEGIESDMVLCRRCQTPHHRECWHYYGSCTTYGCGETRFDELRIPPAMYVPHEANGRSKRK
jgi:hypothetical protein